MALSKLFLRKRKEEPAAILYASLVAQARRPDFYRHGGVPDTVDGRFELISLHIFLVLHRLKEDHPASAVLAQALFDLMFADMDQSLREMGAGDLGVGRRVKIMLQGLYGRIAAYEEGLERGEGILTAALGRNVYGTVEPSQACLEALSAYVRGQVVNLAGQDYSALAAGQVDFGPPPAFGG